MKATVMYGAGDVRIEDVPDAGLMNSTDALIRVLRSCICGSDLWPYALMEPTDAGRRMGHEALGLVEAVGGDVQRVKAGDLVIMPFAYSDGTCAYCSEHLHTSCQHGGFFGNHDLGAQAEAVRIPFADGTLFPIDATADEDLLASLLTLSDVMGTGHHAARVARVTPGKNVAVIGDGAVGLCGVIAAKRLGAEHIIMLGRHEDRIALAREFGATDIVSERGQEAIERVRQLTAGQGVHSILECVGSGPAIETALGIARPGGAIGRVGVPHYNSIPLAAPAFFGNITIGGGPAPVRAYINELLPDVLEGKIQPGRVFDKAIGLDGVPAGYAEMNARDSIKVMIRA